MNFFSQLMFKLFPFVRQCQSCGFTLSKDEMKGGTEADGSKSADYCSVCYRDGQFLHPSISQQELLEKVALRFRNMRMPENVIQFLVRKISKEMKTYKRWKNVYTLNACPICANFSNILISRILKPSVFLLYTLVGISVTRLEIIPK